MFKKLFPILLSSIFFVTSVSHASFWETEERLKDVSYTFNAEKMSAAKDSFYFLRSFVDYFYLIYKSNSEKLKSVRSLEKFNGWCAGDAHLENFGYLISEKGNTKFTVNDIDDSGPCPVVLDLFRFLVAAKLYNRDIDLDHIIEEYGKGLSGDSVLAPKIILRMKQKSLRKGIGINENRVDGDRLIRDAMSKEVTPEENSEIQEIIRSYSHTLMITEMKIIDMLSTSKVGGGSGGLRRYEVLVEYQKQLLQLEFKQLVKPSIYPVSGVNMTQEERIQKALFFTQQNNESNFYKVVRVNNLEMLVRPKFGGNVGVILSENSESENEKIALSEAYILGAFHGLSLGGSLHDYLKALQLLRSKNLKDEVQMMSDFFRNKYKSLK